MTKAELLSTLDAALPEDAVVHSVVEGTARHFAGWVGQLHSDAEDPNFPNCHAGDDYWVWQFAGRDSGEVWLEAYQCYVNYVLVTGVFSPHIHGTGLLVRPTATLRFSVWKSGDPPQGTTMTKDALLALVTSRIEDEANVVEYIHQTSGGSDYYSLGWRLTEDTTEIQP